MRGNGVVVRLAARSARRRSGRVAATIAAVTLATAFAVAAFGVAAQMDRLVAGASAAGDVVSTLPEGTVIVTAATSGATEPTALSEALIETASGVDGVLTASGTYEQPIAVRIERGSQDDRPPAFRGLVFTSAFDPQRWTVRSGELPTAAPVGDGLVQVALDAGGLTSADASIGDEIGLQTPTGGVRAVVVGEVEPSGSTAGRQGSGIANANIVLDATVLPGLLAAEGRVDRITVVPEPGVGVTDLTERLGAALPGGLTLASAEDPGVLQARAVTAISGGIATATWAFALLSALVAALLVSNTFSIVVAQRKEELALARCLGLTRSQSVGGFLLEAVPVGVVSASISLVLGVPLSVLGASILQPDATITWLVTSAMVRAALVVGLGVTLLAAFVPALRAGRVSPIEALQAASARRRRRGPLLLVVSPLLDLVALLGRRSRVLTLAVSVPRHDNRRAAATISTLCVGLTLMAMVLTLGGSIRQSVADQFVGNSSADLIIRRRGVVRVDVASLERRLGLPDQRVLYVAASAVEGSLVGPDGSEPTVTSTDLSTGPGLVDLDVTGGLPATLDGGAMVSESTAERIGVSVGDMVTLRSTSGGEMELPLRATYRNTAFFGPAVVDRAAPAAVAAEGSFERAAIGLPDGAPTDRVRRAIDDRIGGFNRLGVDTPQSFAATDSDIAETVTRLALVLLSGSVLLGGLGAANNVSLSVLERRRELALLRAIGAGRRQVRALVAVEAMVLCGLAGLIGAVAGTALGVIGIGMAPVEFAATARVPWSGLAALVLGAVVVGAVAAAVPARAAVRREVLADLDAP